MRTSRQASNDVEFEQFGIDVERDLLHAVTGEPVDRNKWGNRIRGAESATVQVQGGLAQLGPLAKNLAQLGRRKDYKRDFDWIDHIVVVNDTALLQKLRDAVLEASLGGLEAATLAPPERVDWSDLEGFRYSVEPRIVHNELNLEHYLGHLGNSAKELSFDTMRRHRIEALNGDGIVKYEWSVAQALVAQFSYGGQTYLLEEGDFLLRRNRVSQRP